jgi:formylglycine-generating enzyme required for sulfatase activity
VWVRTRFHEFEAGQREGADLTVQWSSQRAPTVVWYGDTVALRRGIRRDPIPVDRSGGPRQVIVALTYESTDSTAQEFAARLLDGGDVDLVFLGQEPMAAVEDWLSEEGPLRSEDALIAVGMTIPLVNSVFSIAQNGRSRQAQRYALAEPDLVRWLKESEDSARSGSGYSLNVLSVPTPGADPEPRPASLRISVIGGVLLDLATIPAGSFLMGSPEAEDGRDIDEGPQRRVELSTFRIGRTEVTRAQYSALCNWKAEWGPSGAESHLPATHVAWFDAVRFCNALSKREGLAMAYDQEHTDSPVFVRERSGYRLPLEAQWEYACRAGTKSYYWSGDSETDLGRVGWYAPNTAFNPQPVAEKAANPFGLYDVHGNSFEWCHDWFAEQYIPSDREDPVGPVGGPGRVLRGGSFRDDAGGCRSADRSKWFPGQGQPFHGFRVVLPVPPERD